VAPGRVWQDRVLGPVDLVQQRLLRRVVKVEAPDRHGDDLRVGCGIGVAHLLGGSELPAAHQQPRAKLLACDFQNVVHAALLRLRSPHRKRSTHYLDMRSGSGETFRSRSPLPFAGPNPVRFKGLLASWRALSLWLP